MKTSIIAKRIIKQTINDKRTLALMLLAPLIVLTLVFYLFNTTNDAKIKIGVDNVESAIVSLLKEYKDVKLVEYNNSKNIKDKIINDELTAFMSYSQSGFKITYNNFDVTLTKKASTIINTVILKNKLNNLSKSLEVMSQQYTKVKQNDKIINSYFT